MIVSLERLVIMLREHNDPSLTEEVDHYVYQMLSHFGGIATNILSLEDEALADFTVMVGDLSIRFDSVTSSRAVNLALIDQHQDRGDDQQGSD